MAHSTPTPLPWHPFPPSRTWSAHWIWTPEESKANTVTLFRKTFDALNEARDAVFHITAETRYEAFLDGDFIGRGPPPSQPWFHYYESLALATVKPGEHTLAVWVYNLGRPETRPGLLAELVDGDGNTLTGTDNSWKAVRAEAWWSEGYRFRMNQFTPHQEFFDAQKLPPDWPVTAFDDSTWPRAQVIQGRESARVGVSGPWSRLVPRDIPPMDGPLLYPESILRTEECVDILNRDRPNDLAPSLSQVGKAVEKTRLENPDNLLRPEGDTIFESSHPENEANPWVGRWDPCVVLDFGRILTAFPQLEIEGPAGAQIEIGYHERLMDGHFNITVEAPFADRVTLRAGAMTYQPINWRAFRYMKLRVKHAQTPVTIRAVRAQVTTFPFEEKGAFSSSDEVLNQTWEISRYTLRLCSNEFIMDTPWREAAQWLGDIAAVSLGGIYACFGDDILPGKFLRQAAQNQYPTGMLSNVSNMTASTWWNATIPDYSLEWIMGLWNHYSFTGEEKWVHAFYTTSLRIIEKHLPHVNARGFVEDMPYWVFIDWAWVDRRGECCPYNALFYGALEALQKMAQLRRDQPTLALTGDLLARQKEHFHAHFYHPDKGTFTDCVVDGEQSARCSEHALATALAFELAEEATARTIVETAYAGATVGIDFSAECQPFFATYLLQGLDRMGRFDLALKLIRERWGGRMVADGARSTYEEWGYNGSWRNGPDNFLGQMRTQSHAWSGHPAEFLIRNLLGLEVREPGCAAITLAPKTPGFDYSATYPTPRGPVTATCKDGCVTTTVPDGVKVL